MEERCLSRVQKGSSPQSRGGHGEGEETEEEAVSNVSTQEGENYKEPKAVATKRSLVNFGEVIFTDTLETRAMFQRTEEGLWSKGRAVGTHNSEV